MRNSELTTILATFAYSALFSLFGELSQESKTRFCRFCARSSINVDFSRVWRRQIDVISKIGSEIKQYFTNSIRNRAHEVGSALKIMIKVIEGAQNVWRITSGFGDPPSQTHSFVAFRSSKWQSLNRNAQLVKMHAHTSAHRRSRGYLCTR